MHTEAGSSLTKHLYQTQGFPRANNMRSFNANAAAFFQLAAPAKALEDHHPKHSNQCQVAIVRGAKCDLVTFLFFCTIFRFSFMTLFLPFFYLRGQFKTRLCRSFESNLTFDSHPARHPDALPSSCLARAASHHPVDRTLLLLSLY